jgi:hypothetical protein
LTADKSKIGSRIGMAFAFMGFGCLAGVSHDDTYSSLVGDYADSVFFFRDPEAALFCKTMAPVTTGRACGCMEVFLVLLPLLFSS